MHLFQIVSRSDTHEPRLTYGVGPTWFLVREAARIKYGDNLIRVELAAPGFTPREGKIEIRVEPGP